MLFGAPKFINSQVSRKIGNVIKDPTVVVPNHVAGCRFLATGYPHHGWDEPPPLVIVFFQHLALCVVQHDGGAGKARRASVASSALDETQAAGPGLLAPPFEASDVLRLRGS